MGGGNSTFSFLIFKPPPPDCQIQNPDSGIPESANENDEVFEEEEGDTEFDPEDEHSESEYF